MSILLEICVDSPGGLAAAITGGADRIELCSALELGGLTPTPGLIGQAAVSPIPIYAMIRPRPGNFVFGEADIDAMLREIDVMRTAGLAGVVFGANLTNGQLDHTTLERLVRQCGGLGVTLHRAFDLVPDLAEAINMAIELGFERILTSGRSLTALDGIDDLEATFELTAGRIKIMPGSGINIGNIGVLRDRIPLEEIHSSCASAAPVLSEAARRLGFETASQRQTSVELVRALKDYCLRVS
ncbi:copper homeostasis protein [Phyllobacterium trifolii]|jgi:copper homeostasis protein|uniref:PF03932 family protein CutC n=1 Tax=Phyllobacterium trifolii TaxID=300193 RepID=A0A839UD22_9HYPH|nr:copper homeostasis protein CutC [Phyllobacterium trifolii]MBB3146581.1 copper homeostasis protein [Phyllobacterium trifolii]